jgi:hypothetical protein
VTHEWDKWRHHENAVEKKTFGFLREFVDLFATC